MTKIEWCDWTWNIITGCNRLCRDETGKIYCFAYWMAQRLKGRYGYPKDEPFRPTFHANKLLEPLDFKKSKRIFVNSMGEFFDPEVPELWRDLVMRVMLEAEQHKFLILTKQAGSIPYELEYQVPSNVWIGVSLDGTSDSAWDVEELLTSYAPHRFVSIEPLLGPVEFDAELVDWIIIGAQTGPRAKQPKKAWVVDIIREANRCNVPVFLKDNLEWATPEIKRQEFPEGLIK